MGDVAETVVIDDEDVSSTLTVNGVAVTTYRVDVLIEGDFEPVTKLVKYLVEYCRPHKARFFCVNSSCHRAAPAFES
jgi:hypothetical protein